MITKRNKKGSKILSVYWFVILAIVAGGIITIVLIFYGKPYDVRNIEAEIIVNKIVDCLSDEGKLRTEINNKNILQECSFVLNGDFYFEVLEIKQGNFNLKGSCGKAENIVCVEKKVYLLTEGGGEVIKILSIVREHENV